MYSLRISLLLYAHGALSFGLDYAVKETHNVPARWTAVGAASKDDSILLRIGLKSSTEDLLESHLLEVSDPAHHRYKQYLSADEVAKLSRPSDETQKLVEEWLHDHDVWQYAWNEPALDWISAKVTIQKAEEMLQTRYAKFVHDESGAVVHRTTEFSLPLHLHEHIDVVQPTTSFFGASRRQLRSKTTRLEERNDVIGERQADDTLAKACKGRTGTPECTRTLYGTIDVGLSFNDRFAR